MNYFSDLAKKYNAKVFLAMRLLVVSMSVQSAVRFDIGFGRSDRRKSIIFPHYELGGGVYVYGYGAREISAYLREIDRLPETIRHLLSEYVFSLEWDGKNLIARVNMWYGEPSKDGTYGERFLIELQEVAESVKSIVSLGRIELENTRLKIGPVWLRKASNVAAFLFPWVCFISFGFWVVPHILSAMHK